MGSNRFASRFARTCKSAVSPVTLGLACILVWNQCILYGQRISVDGGIATVATTLVRCVAIAVLFGVAVSPVWRGKIPRWWELTSIALMSASGLIELIGGVTNSQSLSWIGIAVSAIGITWGGGMWIQSCIRFSLRNAFIIVTAAMGFSAAAGILICFLPLSFCASLGIILPIVSYACYRRSFGDNDPSVSEPLAFTRAFPKVEGEVRNVLMSIAAFSIVLGISRGYPDGASLVIPSVLLPMQFVLVIVVVLYVMVMLSSPAFKPKAGPIWACYIGMLTVGVFLVFSMDDRMVGWGATLVSAINLLQVLMLWMLACDTARNASAPPFGGLAILWVFHLFFREFGRMAIYVLPASTIAIQTIYLAVTACLLALAVALLFAGKRPAGKAFFADYVYQETVSYAPLVADHSEDGLVPRMVSTGCAPAAHQDGGAIVGSLPATSTGPIAQDSARASTQAPAAQTAPLQPSAFASTAFDLGWLKNEHGLTQRECEVAEQLALNRSAAVIAEKLFLSKETVRSYTKTIYMKTGVHSKAELSALFKDHGDPRMSL